MKLTPGKLAGMKAVSDRRGMIAAAAMDQRGSLQKTLAKEKGADVGSSMLEEFRSIVTEVLTPHASAILLDPELGLPAAKRRSKNAGLLLAYEHTGYDKAGSGWLAGLSGGGLRESTSVLHADRRHRYQRQEICWGGAHWRRTPRQRHSILPGIPGVIPEVVTGSMAEFGGDMKVVLFGRATWKESIPVYAKQGTSALMMQEAVESPLPTSGVAAMKSETKSDVTSALTTCSQTAGDQLKKNGNRLRSQLALAVATWICGLAADIAFTIVGVEHSSDLRSLLLSNGAFLLATQKMARIFLENYRRAAEDEKYYAGIKQVVDDRTLAYCIWAEGRNEAALQAFAERTVESADRHLAALNNVTSRQGAPEKSSSAGEGVTDVLKECIKNRFSA